MLNLVIKPIIKLISTPIIILTLGLFTIVINAIILLAVDIIFESVIIDGVYSLVLATIIIALTNTLITKITKLI